MLNLQSSRFEIIMEIMKFSASCAINYDVE